jgi:hypothetical protein
MPQPLPSENTTHFYKLYCRVEGWATEIPIKFTKYNEYREKLGYMVYEVECIHYLGERPLTIIAKVSSEPSCYFKEWLELFTAITGEDQFRCLEPMMKQLQQHVGLDSGSTPKPFVWDMDADIDTEPLFIRKPAYMLLEHVEKLVTDPDAALNYYTDSDDDSYRDEGFYETDAEYGLYEPDASYEFY